MIAEPRVFVDTNVLIYVRDPAAGDKQAAAAGWLRALAKRRCLVMNLQVLNELTRWVLRNEQVPLATARQRIDELRHFCDAGLQPSHLAAAWAVREKLGYQWFDCLLIAWASEERCSHFLSEDMSHGTRYGSLMIVNPFRVDPDSILSKN